MFDTVVTVDWSGGNQKSVKPCPDAIWVSIRRGEHHEAPQYFRNRQAVEPFLHDLIEQELIHGRRAFLGFDFAFGYPQGAVERITGSQDPLAYWGWLDQRIEDAPKSNNRFDVAAQINAMSDGIGPFWGNGLKRDIAHLPRKGTTREPELHRFTERRQVERLQRGAFSVWQLSGIGSVGSQVLMGLPVLYRLRQAFKDQIAVWPFEPLTCPIAFVEVWPSLFNTLITPRMGEHPIKDAVQMHVLTEHIADMPKATLTRLLNVPATHEGWIFGVDAPSRTRPSRGPAT